VLALLLARNGVPATVLEAHDDFGRDFRGDVIRPTTREALDQPGLADWPLRPPHGWHRAGRTVSPRRSEGNHGALRSD
jgi:2-polyprenyl-6-methoxyphenol hydroxylase-like FAD-dependent oxidoreductase